MRDPRIDFAMCVFIGVCLLLFLPRSADTGGGLGSGHGDSDGLAHGYRRGGAIGGAGGSPPTADEHDGGGDGDGGGRGPHLNYYYYDIHDSHGAGSTIAPVAEHFNHTDGLGASGDITATGYGAIACGGGGDGSSAAGRGDPTTSLSHVPPQDNNDGSASSAPVASKERETDPSTAERTGEG